MHKFSGYVQDYNEKDSKTHSGMVDNTIAIMSHPIPNTNDPCSVGPQIRHVSSFLSVFSMIHGKLHYHIDMSLSLL